MLDVKLKPGTYIVAVSGGVDSVVLLDVLSGLSGVDLVVAHVNHGIRQDSDNDAALVKSLAKKYQLPYEETRLDLMGKTDENSARQARYAWLNLIRERYAADAIITAHHSDDVIETILINLIRGTGWRGLCSLRETDLYKRPFIDKTKADITRYAIEHDLQWREDSTNEDMRYLRNYVRYGIIPRLNSEQTHELRALYKKQCKIGEMITAVTKQLLRLASEGEGCLSRYWLIMTPDNVAQELLRQKYGAMTKAQLTKLLIFARTARQGARLELSKHQQFTVTARQLIVGTPWN